MEKTSKLITEKSYDCVPGKQQQQQTEKFLQSRQELAKLVKFKINIAFIIYN